MNALSLRSLRQEKTAKHRARSGPMNEPLICTPFQNGSAKLKIDNTEPHSPTLVIVLDVLYSSNIGNGRLILTFASTAVGWPSELCGTSKSLTNTCWSQSKCFEQYSRRLDSVVAAILIPQFVESPAPRCPDLSNQRGMQAVAITDRSEKRSPRHGELGCPDSMSGRYFSFPD